MNFIKNNQAFSLVQIIVTVAIILVLASTALFGEDIIARRGDAKDVQRYKDITAIANAVELYQVDNTALPSDLLAAVTIDADEKYVLCSSAATRTCDGQSRACLVIDDIDLLDTYLGGALPVDPDKTAVTDTGYYIARNGDQMVFGSCDSYSGDTIEYTAKAKMPPLCGNGIVEDDEVCDDGDLVTEGCGIGGESLENAGTYCNSDCTAEVTTSVNEVCDYYPWSNNCRLNGVWYTTSDIGGPSFCRVDCAAEIPTYTACDDVPIE